MKKLSVSIFLLLTCLSNQVIPAGLISNGNNSLPYKVELQTIQKEKTLKLLEQAVKIANSEKNADRKKELLSSLAVLYEIRSECPAACGGDE